MRDVWNDAVIAEIADLLVYQSVLRPKQASEKILAGVEYVMVDPAYATCVPDFDGPIVVSMGGSDQHGLTLQMVDALLDFGPHVIVINGAAAVPIESIEGVTFIQSPPSLLPYLDGAALLIGALGMTAYEAAAAGVPSILTSWSDDHLATAIELEKRGVCLSLGLWNMFNQDELRLHLSGLLGNRDRWKAMSDAGKWLVYGRGVERVADRIMELIA